MQITLTLNEKTENFLKALAEVSGDNPETLAESLLSDIVLSAAENPELIGEDE
jgi:hypothetical protein